MTERDVLIVGAGPAGLAAAVEASRFGLSVEIVEQRETIGGAIHRQPIAGVPAIRQSAAAARRWRKLSAAFARSAVSVSHASVLIGIDGDGLVLVEDRKKGRVRAVAAKVVILAVGAVERVLPRPGWHLAGVSTAGGLQVMMKETGRPPAGRVLLAGNGPLLVAVAAQMARLGNPPVAVVEAGDPFARPAAGIALAASPGIAAEALGYLGAIVAHRTKWMRGVALIGIERDQGGLSARLRDRSGRDHVLPVDRIGLHDGIRPNDFGLPVQETASPSRPLVLRAGDCRDALGADAAVADGARAGREAILHITGGGAGPDRDLARFRRVQAVLARLFQPVGAESGLTALPDETVLCRCENRSVGDLKALCQGRDGLTGREVKHNGRFSMGACQGRFCADNTAALMAALRPGDPRPGAEDLTGRRWPLRPLPIGALVAAGGDAPLQHQQDESTE